MHKTDHYTSRWIKAVDLRPEGENFTIKQFTTESVGQKQEPKPVMSFAETDKDWILNKRQWDDVWELLGDDDDTALWIGKRIKLCPVKVDTKDGLKNSIRVETADPPEKTAEKLTLSRPISTPAPVEAEIPF